MQVISGKDLSTRLKADMAKQVATYKERYRRLPKLSVILVGNDPGSVSYVTGKAKASEEVGILNETIRLDASTTEAELLRKIDELNADSSVDGILVQLPLPKHIDTNKILETISPEKDVDGFAAINVGKLASGLDGFVPCTPLGIMEIFKAYDINLEGKNAVVIGRSNIVGKPMANLLLNANATVTVTHSKTRNLKEICADADILVAAIGRADFVTADMVKEGAVVIDVGINRMDDGKLKGDVKFDEVAPKCSFITPVPGGVGPMTIAMLLSNTIKSAKNRAKKA
mgnify:CR=1 FL=1